MRNVDARAKWNLMKFCLYDQKVKNQAKELEETEIAKLDEPSLGVLHGFLEPGVGEKTTAKTAFWESLPELLKDRINAKSSGMAQGNSDRRHWSCVPSANAK